jgi:hypothetical protein
VLLLIVDLVVVVLLDVVILVGGVKLLSLRAVGDEVSGVASLKVAPRWSPPLLAELVQGTEISHLQGDLVVRGALVLLIRICGQKRQNKLKSRWDSGVGRVSIMVTNMSTSNHDSTSRRSIMIWMTFMR